MRVDQTATALPTASGLKSGPRVNEETRAQVAVVQPQTTSPLSAAGLRVSISEAGRQAAASATQSPLTYSLMDGVPWPVGLGPPAWPQTQGAAGVTKLVAAQVSQLPQQNPVLSKVPTGAEIAAEVAQAKTVPAVAARLQSMVAGAAPQSRRETRDSVTATEPRKTGSANAAYAGDAASVPAQEPKLHLRA